MRAMPARLSIPATASGLTDAAARVRPIDIRGGKHYLAGQPAPVAHPANPVAEFAMSL